LVFKAIIGKPIIVSHHYFLPLWARTNTQIIGQVIKEAKEDKELHMYVTFVNISNV